MQGIVSYCDTKMYYCHKAEVVEQLTELMVPRPEDPGSNPAISNF